MTSLPPSTCCVEGSKHSGPSTGSVISIAGKWTGYLAVPPPAVAIPGAAILYLPDVFGIWKNSEMMADAFAAAGYVTLLVDLFNGDPVPQDYTPGGSFVLADWLAHGSSGDNPHTPEFVDPIASAALETLRTEYKMTRIGAVGYCFGARYLARVFSSGLFAGFMAHPSFVSEEELRSVNGPLSIAAAETDSIFTTELRHQSEEILRDMGITYQMTLYSGVSHGFAVRGDLSVKHVRFAKEQAMRQAVSWFEEFL